MTTSPQTPFLSEIGSGLTIPVGKLAYFQERAHNNWYNYVLTKFLEKERTGELTRAQLARRIGRSPAVITRLLGAPGNWTLDTVTDLLLGIAAEEMTPASSSVLNRSPQNFRTADWLKEAPQTPRRASETGTGHVGTLELVPNR